MNDADRTAGLSPGQGDDLDGQLWDFDKFSTDEDRSISHLATGLTSVGFIRAALRRSRWLWCATAVAGLLIGLAGFKMFPPAHQASTSILLASNLPGTTGEAVQDDTSIVQSRAVASAALRKLGLHESVGSFTPNYSAVGLTSRVLVITVKATSSAAAVREANALAATFLAFQKHYLYAQQALVNASVQQQINIEQQHVNALVAQLRRLPTRPSPAQHARFENLSNERNEATSELSQLKVANRANAAATKIATVTLVQDSQVLDRAAPLPQHATKYLLLYVGGGLIGGLALGLIIVIVRALVSDRLYRRDDVAQALGAPVKLSVGRVRLSRRWAGRRGLGAAGSTEIRRIVAHLDHEVPPSWGGLASLAVVPVDDVRVPAVCLVSLATSCAQRGFQVVVADLCSGSPAAQLLGVRGSGVHAASQEDARLIVVVPDPDDVTPVGPVGRVGRRSRPAQAAGPLADACASADLLFTLASLDPSTSSEYLAGWARGAVALVTAGRSSAERIHAVGEMIRLARVEMISAVLVGADKTDVSLGVPTPSSPPVPADLVMD